MSSSLTLADTDHKTLWIAKSADVIRFVLLLAGQHCRSGLNARESAYTSSDHRVRADRAPTADGMAEFDGLADRVVEVPDAERSGVAPAEDDVAIVEARLRSSAW